MQLDYLYKARSKGGKLIAGKVAANDRRQAIDLIAQQDLFVVDLREAAVADGNSPVERIFSKVTVRELSIMCHQLAAMMQAGIPLMKSLSILTQQNENKLLAKTLRKVMERLEEGSSLAEALASHRRVFPALFVYMVQAGEASGTLEQVLRRLAATMQKEYELAAKVKSALLYPVIVLAVAGLSVVALLWYVLPKFVFLLESMMVPIPFATLLLVQAGQFMQNYWYLVLTLAISMGIACRWVLRTADGKMMRDKIILRIPLLGTVLRKMLLSRFCWSFSTLLRTGIPVLQALVLVKSIAGNEVLAESLHEAEHSIKSGGSISEPLQQSGFFPPMVVQMIIVGEETGSMDILLEKVAEFYDREVEEQVARLSSSIEPVLIVGLGGIVGFIVLSMMLPVFNAMNYIQ